MRIILEIGLLGGIIMITVAVRYRGSKLRNKPRSCFSETPTEYEQVTLLHQPPLCRLDLLLRERKIRVSSKTNSLFQCRQLHLTVICFLFQRSTIKWSKIVREVPPDSALGDLLLRVSWPLSALGNLVLRTPQPVPSTPHLRWGNFLG